MFFFPRMTRGDEHPGKKHIGSFLDAPWNPKTLALKGEGWNLHFTIFSLDDQKVVEPSIADLPRVIDIFLPTNIVETMV